MRNSCLSFFFLLGEVHADGRGRTDEPREKREEEKKRIERKREYKPCFFGPGLGR